MESKSYNDPSEMVKMLKEKGKKDDGYIGLTSEDRETRMKEVQFALENYIQRLEALKNKENAGFIMSQEKSGERKNTLIEHQAERNEINSYR